MKDTLSLALALTLILSACGGKKETSNASAEQPTTPQEAMKQAEKALEQADLQQPVEPVNFRKLQELLPTETAGYTRTKAGGESAGAMGIKFSQAKGDYKNSEGNRLRILITDTGGLGMTTMSMAAWSTMTIDKEDDNGYERTSTLNGYKCLEKYRKQGEDCELAVFAENRFIINATCRGCSMETVRSAVNGLNLNTLKNLE
ncbi:MAG: hypothetical protein JNJ90_07170 [Saprospiraceae bacterium]|jgi:hypothetical protein|nr:hypothetical protein [Saprospiraceae bacterium]